MEKFDEKRKIVIPGEVIIEGNEYLPSDGAYREGKEVIAKRIGVVDISDKYVRVIPVSGAYFPRRGNTIIGTITEITMRGWVVDIGGITNAFLPVSEVPRFINKNELKDFLDFGDTIIAKIWDSNSRGIDLSIKQRGLGKIDDGNLIQINPNKVPRIIGKEGSMVKLIRNATHCNITVGQNGKIWINANSIDDEIKTIKIIEYVVENATINGLTEKVQKFIKDMGLEVIESPEIIEENTDEDRE
ncbi:S1 RNA-binding domain-containing protein [Patescibacteria group bacterium]|nr:S1 RNA-binding domain-containing protein [Patescibacteria group bacterium]